MNEQISVSRLQYFPIPFFAVIMGLSGLTIVYQKAHEVLGLSSIFGNILAFIDVSLFVVIFFTYMLKFVKYPSEVKKEFGHKIRINFFAAISISMLLVSIVLHPINELASFGIFLVGVVVHTFFTFHTVSFWINHNFEIMHSNPAWFIPIVGNVLVPVAGHGYVPNEFLMFYFSVGMFFWLVLFTITLNRIIFHNQLPVKFIPTLFILIAPPAVGFIAYIKLAGHFDLFAQFLFQIGLFFTFLIAFMYKNFLKIKFFISWWAFTFPMAAITIATILAFKITNSVVYKDLAYLLIVATTLIIAVVVYQTVIHMMKKEICVLED
jgi:tellurite resistance protein